MPQISMKDAVSTAKTIINELYADEVLNALALEEIELVMDGETESWAVTLGFYRPKSVTVKSGAVSSLLQPTQVENRDYKKLFINAENGAFTRMEIRPTP